MEQVTVWVILPPDSPEEMQICSCRVMAHPSHLAASRTFPTHAPATCSLADLFSRALLNLHERAGDSARIGTQGFLSFPGKKCFWLRGKLLVELPSEAGTGLPIHLFCDTGCDGKENRIDEETGFVVLWDPEPPTSWAHHPPFPRGRW